MLNFFEMSTKELEGLQLHWGAIDFEKLIGRLHGSVDGSGRSGILENPWASEIFEAWMSRNLSSVQIALLRIYYGKDSAGYASPELYEHEIFSHSKEENEADLERAFKAIQNDLSEYNYLGHALVNKGWSEDYDSDIYYDLECDKYEQKMSDFLLEILGVNNCPFKLDVCGLKDSIMEDARKQGDAKMMAIVSYALTGEAELWLDEEYRIFGMPHEIELQEELWESCWERIVTKQYISASHIQTALQKEIEEYLLDSELAEMVAEELYILEHSRVALECKK